MTALADKMEKAGVDTVGAKLMVACIVGLRHWPNNPRLAWDYAFKEFGREYVMGIMADMAPPSPAPQPAAPAKPSIGTSITRADLMASREYKPRVIPPERLEKRRELKQIVRSKYKNSSGVAWSEVSWSDLSAMKRDGNEAEALLLAGPAHVPNDGRSVGQVLSIKQIDEIIQAVRA